MSPNQGPEQRARDRIDAAARRGRRRRIEPPPQQAVHAIDGDLIEARALGLARSPIGSDPGDTLRNQAQQQLVDEDLDGLLDELNEALVA